MNNFIKSFKLIIIFFTRIPLNYPYEYKESDFTRGIKLIPLVGLVIGLFISLPFLFASFLDKPIIVLLVWLLYVWITGALHIDGLTDSIDGLFSNRDKEKMFEIMSDSRIGAFGVIGLVFTILFNLVLSYYLGYEFFIIMPIVGRISSLLAASISQYAKSNKGMGSLYIEESKVSYVFAGNLLVLALGLVLNLNVVYLAFTLILTQGVVVLSTGYIKKKIGGMTGDTVGLMVEFSQTIYLFLTYVFFNIK